MGEYGAEPWTEFGRRRFPEKCPIGKKREGRRREGNKLGKKL